jgi:hypothetical protein
MVRNNGVGEVHSWDGSKWQKMGYIVKLFCVLPHRLTNHPMKMKNPMLLMELNTTESFQWKCLINKCITLDTTLVMIHFSQLKIF